MAVYPCLVVFQGTDCHYTVMTTLLYCIYTALIIAGIGAWEAIFGGVNVFICRALYKVPILAGRLRVKRDYNSSSLRYLPLAI